MNDTKQKVWQLAEQVAEEQGVEIFDIEFLGKHKILLRVTLDKEEGITLDECEKFSKSFVSLLDVEDPISGSYTLEVSSPGLDRPLRSLKDFEKNKGKLVRIVSSEKIENQNFIIGRIIDIRNGFIQLLANKAEIDIPFEKIEKAKLEIEITCQKSSATS